MRKYPGIPELLETYMEENTADERWVTVQEIRDRFCLTRYQSSTVSGFLRRLKFGPFGQCPYTVLRIEHAEGISPSNPPKCRYLVTRRPQAHQKKPGDISTRLTGTQTHDVFTDSAAIEHFNRVLLKKRDRNGL